MLLKNQNNCLSCIIITYNQSNYLFDAIDSVLAQDYPDIELIIADDCSKGFDEGEIKSYIEKYKMPSLRKYVVYSNSCNLGTVKNINGALKKATGAYIKIFGGDDMIAGIGVFSSQVEYLKCNPYDYIVTGKSKQCDEEMHDLYDINVENNNRLIPAVISAKTKEEKHRLIAKNYIFPFMTQSMCFRREFFDDFGVYDERFQLLEDTPMMDRIIDKEVKIGFQDIEVIKHRTKVGVSSVDILYSIGSLRYYEDCKLLSYDKLHSSSKLANKVKAWHNYRIASLRVDLCRSNTITKKVVCYILYFPNILLYLIQNPKKSYIKIKKRIVN